MKKILAALAAAALLAGGVTVAAIVTGSSAQAQEDQTTTTTTTTDSTTDSSTVPDKGGLLSSVLDDLVASNQISRDQADKILSALEAKRQELGKAGPFGFGPGHGPRFGPGVDIQALLADGVIDSNELASLPDGNILTDPNGPFAAAAADGQITQEEFQGVLQTLRDQMENRPGDRPFPGFGFRFGPNAPDAEGTSA